MKPVTFLSEAKWEFLDAIDYYDDKAPELGWDFEKEVKKTVTQIRESPKRYPKYDEDTQKYVLPRFPYSIFYMYYQNHIWILAIAPHKKRPGYWERRKNKIQPEKSSP